MSLLPPTTDAEVTTEFFHITDKRRGTYRIVQVAITASALLSIQGRLTSVMPWHTIETFTESGAKSVALFTHMRLVVTGNTGTASAEIDV